MDCIYTWALLLELMVFILDAESTEYYFFSKVNVEYLYFVTWVFSEQLNQGFGYRGFNGNLFSQYLQNHIKTSVTASSLVLIHREQHLKNTYFF